MRENRITLVRPSDYVVIYEVPFIKVHPNDWLRCFVSHGSPAYRISKQNNSQQLVDEKWSSDNDWSVFYLFAKKCHRLLVTAYREEDDIGKALNEVLGNNLEPLKTLARDLGSFTENYTRVVNPTETHAITAQEYAEIIVNGS